MHESEVLSSIHRALIGFNKRAEQVAEEILEATFVDSAPLFELLSTRNNQVIYGRRGTGKTHALKYLAQSVTKAGEKSIYIDLRSVGSNGSIYSDGSRSKVDRASTLIIDVLNALLNELYQVAVSALETAPDVNQVTIRLDDFAQALSSVRISGEVQRERSESTARAGEAGFKSELGSSGMSGSVNLAASVKQDVTQKTVSKGSETVHLNFGTVGTALNGLVTVLGIRRLWVLFDEWSEVPVDIQPYLADLLRRTLLPTNQITVKIAAIEHRSNFSIHGQGGSYVGLELGADISADLNLDDFLVFDNNQQKSTAFFKTLLYRHYDQSDDKIGPITTPEELIQAAFTQAPVFDEFVRAIEGVPRDALNLAAKIATKAFGTKIAMSHVRNAARDWYQQDKQAAIRGNAPLSELLAKIIDEVIAGRRARAFLFPSNIRAQSIDKLFDARILHILKKNVSSKDEPGARYDVYKIDYGCYVDLVNTAKAPAGLFEIEDDEFVEVPRDDYRSIRRAILRPEQFSLPDDPLEISKA